MCSIDYPSDIVSWRPPAAKDPATDPTSSAETEKEVNYIDVALDTTVQACKHSRGPFLCEHSFEW